MTCPKERLARQIVLRQRGCVPEEPVVYREEVLTIMGALGDVRRELEDIHALLEDDDDEAEEDSTDS